MEQQKIREYIAKVAGNTLRDVNLICEMLAFDFGGYSIHAQCFTRIVCEGKILLTNLDYQSFDGVTAENNDEWYNMSIYKSKIVNNKVKRIELTATNDLMIYLDSGVQIQMFVSNSEPHYGEDEEQWRLICDKEDCHIVINSKTIDYLN